MIVPSVQFLLFAAVSALLFNLGCSVLWRQGVLLVVNAAFLASFSHSPLAVAPFAGFIAFGFLAQRAVRNGRAPHLFVPLLGLTLFVFFWLKRYVFIPHAAFLPFAYLLVGLSYVFFRVLHLIIDSYQGAVAEPVSPLSYLNYTLNFTSLTSGPIQRYQDYRQTEITRLPLTVEQAGGAFERIVRGTFKVAIVSLVLSLVQHHAIDNLPLAGRNTPAAVLWGALTVAVYPVYLYFNFSGYVDVVIGVARFFRIELPENFDHPFSSENFLGFWSRWHMTLSNWLKTYVFNPLLTAGLARVTAPAWTPYLAVGAFSSHSSLSAFGTAKRPNSCSSACCRVAGWPQTSSTKFSCSSAWADGRSRRCRAGMPTASAPVASPSRGLPSRCYGSGQPGRKSGDGRRISAGPDRWVSALPSSSAPRLCSRCWPSCSAQPTTSPGAARRCSAHATSAPPGAPRWSASPSP